MTGSQTERYRTMSSDGRSLFLESHVFGNQTDLSADFLLEAIAEEKDPTLQWFLIKGIGILKLSGGIEALLRICKTPEREMGHTSLHSICAWSLGQIGTPAYQSVTELLGEPDPETRRTAVDSLGEIGDSRAIPLLCAALERDEHRVRLWAGLSLAKMGAGALPCLERISSEQDEAGRVIAADAITKIGRSQSVANKTHR